MVVAWQIIFFITASIYASAGLGGASAYLAYLSIMGIDYRFIPPTALTLSVLSTFTSGINWIRGGYFRKKMIPIVVVSAPAAFLGGLLRVSKSLFDVLLGVVLIAVGFVMLFQIGGDRKANITFLRYALVLMFAIMFGFIGGVVGIGCGIFMGPVSYLLGVTDEKETATLNSVFIFTNSLTGLIGHITKSHFDLKLVIYFSLPVIIGAFAGSNLGARKLSQSAVRKIFAVVISSIGVFRMVSVLLKG